MGAVYIAATVALTVYGQLAFKWRIDEFRASEASVSTIGMILRLAIDPWIISVVLATALASITWGAGYENGVELRLPVHGPHLRFGPRVQRHPV